MSVNKATFTFNFFSWREGSALELAMSVPYLLTYLLTYSLRQKSSNLIDTIVVTRERRIVGIKVRKQGPTKIKF